MKKKKRRRRKSNACAFISVNSPRGRVRSNTGREGGAKVVTFRIDKSREKR